ncbi:MAG: hypothetical protein ABIQ12_10700 [Opitutaceae bacterium]
MNEQEFIELLNLYLDHEISATDAVRLETEVRGDVQRRALYNQYCRMHKACTALGADFVTSEVAAFDPTATALEDTRRRRHVAYYGFATLTAAAACVAFVFVGRGGPVENVNVGDFPPAIAAVAAPAASVATTHAGGIVQRSRLVSDPLLLSAPTRSDIELAALTAQTPDQLAWIQGVRLAPLQLGVAAANLRFDAAPATLRPDARTLMTQPASADAAVEMAAFRFQK